MTYYFSGKPGHQSTKRSSNAPVEKQTKMKLFLVICITLVFIAAVDSGRRRRSEKREFDDPCTIHKDCSSMNCENGKCGKSPRYRGRRSLVNVVKKISDMIADDRW